ncbi:hypothetical protein E4U58_002091 [Claviceps cyperi]|nr:hypothetical protein E4U58_002091 [Claviceps cyperi]
MSTTVPIAPFISPLAVQTPEVLRQHNLSSDAQAQVLLKIASVATSNVVAHAAVDLRTMNVSPKMEPRIFNYFPIYQNADDTREDYARVKLTLHHPHRHFDNVK